MICDHRVGSSGGGRRRAPALVVVVTVVLVLVVVMAAAARLAVVKTRSSAGVEAAAKEKDHDRGEARLAFGTPPPARWTSSAARSGVRVL